MEIKSLKEVTHDELFCAFQQAFADYEVQLDKQGLFNMLKRRGFAPNLSFGAFDENKLISFTCNGIGDFYGTRMAYDTGTGTLKAYRGTGLATRIFEHSIPFLKSAGIQEYLLEVLQHNTDAISVYKKLGFEVAREFYYYRTTTSAINYKVKDLDFPYVIKDIDINEYKSIADFWDFKPSWQNSHEAINRAIHDFICLGLFVDTKLIGYGVFEPASGDVTQIAVDKNFRHKGVGSVLFHNLLSFNKQSAVKIVNTDINCSSISSFFKSKNIEPTGKQFEMIKLL